MEWGEFLRDLLLAAVVFGLGWFAGRGHQTRDLRRSAYVEWLKAARNLPEWPDPSPAPGSRISIPHPDARRRLNDRTTEIAIVGSARVKNAAGSYLDQLDSADFLAEMGRSTGLIDAVERFDRSMKPYRDAVIRGMRRDLLPWWGELRALRDQGVSDSLWHPTPPVEAEEDHAAGEGDPGRSR